MYYRISPIAKWASVILFLLCLGACEDVIEADLKGERVALLGPPDGISDLPNTVEFNWQEVDAAFNYRIQVVTPSFDSLLYFRLDSLVSDNSFTYPFSPGTYEWRVRAENSNSVSIWSYRSFATDSVVDLSASTPSLFSPADQFITAADSITFDWLEVLNAETYTYEARFETVDGVLAIAPITLDTSETRVALPEGMLVWSVKANNSVPSTSQVALRNLVVDRTPPEAATLQFPEDLQVFATDTLFDFDWTTGVDLLTEVNDSVFVYSGNGSVNPILSLTTLDSEFSTSSFAPSVYEWEVKGTDAAGNISITTRQTFSIE